MAATSPSTIVAGSVVSVEASSPPPPSPSPPSSSKKDVTSLRGFSKDATVTATTTSDGDSDGGVLERKRPRRRRKGRSARRRAAKARAILDAFDRLWGDNDGRDGAGSGEARSDGKCDPARGVGVRPPSDRGASLPGVVARRLEEGRRKKRRRQGSKGFDGGSARRDVDEDEGKEEEGRAGASLPSIDARRLARQLGFVPGNAVAVCGRLGGLPRSVSDCLPPSVGAPGCRRQGEGRGGGGEGRGERSDDDEPTVLKLYPLAMRDAYGGGKSDGRKFKGRRRGNGRERGRRRERTRDGEDDDGGEPPASASIVEPFPTLYWLTHPILRTLVSRLEISPGRNVKAVEAKLAASPSDLAAMRDAHESYGVERWKYLTESDRADVINRGWEGALGNGRGVAGIRNERSVKCLHAHAAHYLSGGEGSERNVVGRWVVEWLGEMLSERKTTKNGTPNRGSGNETKGHEAKAEKVGENES